MQASEFRSRRQQFLNLLDKNSIAIFPTAPHFQRTYDSHFPFRPNSDFFYLTGFPEPEAVAVFLPGEDPQYILFNRVRDPAMEIWTGRRAGQKGACEQYGADASYPIAEIKDRLFELMKNKNKIYYAFGRHAELDLLVNETIDKLRTQVRTGITIPEQISNVETIVHEMRLIKSEAEIKVMRDGAKISAQAHREAMRHTKPNKFEYEIEAVLMQEFYRHGSRFPAYNSIVASGENACVLHYDENSRCMQVGDLLLIDAGAELDCYASDITRTFPVNGKFTKEQQAIYELVLEVQVAMINWIKPGVVFDQGQQQAIRLLTQGLVDLKLLSGEVDNLIETLAYRRFYMHRLSHWLGMDVHDVGSYKKNNAWRELQAGMVLTVEPGIYISKGDDVDEKWWDIGVRIEDDVLVTATGRDVLSADAPKTVSDLEAIMNT